MLSGNIAGAATVWRADDMLIFTISANQSRIGWAVEREIGFIERRGQMAQPGVDGNHAACASQNLSNLLKAHARQYIDVIASFRQPFCPRLFVRRAPRQLNTYAATCQ